MWKDINNRHRYIIQCTKKKLIQKYIEYKVSPNVQRTRKKDANSIPFAHSPHIRRDSTLYTLFLHLYALDYIPIWIINIFSPWSLFKIGTGFIMVYIWNGLYIHRTLFMDIRNIILYRLIAYIALCTFESVLYSSVFVTYLYWCICIALLHLTYFLLHFNVVKIVLKTLDPICNEEQIPLFTGHYSDSSTLHLRLRLIHQIAATVSYIMFPA